MDHTSSHSEPQSPRSSVSNQRTWQKPLETSSKYWVKPKAIPWTASINKHRCQIDKCHHKFYASDTTILNALTHLNSISLYHPLQFGDDVADPDENGSQAYHRSGIGVKHPGRLLHSLIPAGHPGRLGTMWGHRWRTWYPTKPVISRGRCAEACQS